MGFRFFLCALLAVGIHGIGHWLSARLLGVRLCKLRRTPTGLRLLSDAHGLGSYAGEGIIALGGPTANVFTGLASVTLYPPTELLLFFGAVSASLALLNLLPIREFDGARVLSSLFSALPFTASDLSPHTVERILDLCSLLCVVLLWLLSVYLLLQKGSALALYCFCGKLFLTITRSTFATRTQAFATKTPNL